MITVKVKENNWYELTVDSWIRRFIGLAPKTRMIKHLDDCEFFFQIEVCIWMIKVRYYIHFTINE